MFNFFSCVRSRLRVLGVWATNCAIFVPWHMTHAKLHSNINVFFSQMNGTHVEKCLQFNVLGVGCTHLFLMLGTVLESMERGQRPVQFLWLSTWYKRSYVPTSAYFWSFNGRYPRWTTKTMIQMWWCLKELWRNWINLLSTIVTHTAKAMICRISRLIRNAKRSSSIPIVLFLPSINRPLLKFLTTITTTGLPISGVATTKNGSYRRCS